MPEAALVLADVDAADAAAAVTPNTGGLDNGDDVPPGDVTQKALPADAPNAGADVAPKLNEARAEEKVGTKLKWKGIASSAVALPPIRANPSCTIMRPMLSCTAAGDATLVSAWTVDDDFWRGDVFKGEGNGFFGTRRCSSRRVFSCTDCKHEIQR
jgi:hypothetical protein